MSKAKIENPKVFISYAWGTREYQQKVLAFATELVNDSVDVILDKWSLNEGNDTYVFMEKCVNDETVTNVLLLLDPKYEEKANERSGGVGTETQIISAEIYNNVTQDKFLPVVFERHTDGRIPKPTYLKSILHFDLTNEETYDEEYQRLVKKLYGIEIYKKPALGKKPEWLESEVSVSVKKRMTYDVLKKDMSEQKIKVNFEAFLTEIKNRIINYNIGEQVDMNKAEDYIEEYSKVQSIRNDFLCLMQHVSYVENSEHLVMSLFEEVRNELEFQNGWASEICKTLVHEMFIYVVATYYKNENYAALAYIFNKTYFVGRYVENSIQSFRVFYYYNENLSKAVCEKDKERYYSGTANYWVKSIYTEAYSKNEFVFADVLCYNASVYSESYLGKQRKWFPLTYVYGDFENRYFYNFAKKLYSTEHYQVTAQLFGYTDEKGLKEKMSEVEKQFIEGLIDNYRYNGAFESAPLISHCIKAEDVQKYR